MNESSHCRSVHISSCQNPRSIPFLKWAVELLHNYAQALQDEVTAGKLTPAEAKSLFHQRGRRLNVNGNQGYPVGYNQDGALVVHGANQQLEGKITGAKDSNGVLIADARPAARPRRAASPPISIRDPRPGRTEPVRKTVFARKFAPWNVTISYGLYVDDIDADVRALTVDLGIVLAAASNLSKQAEQLSGEVGTFLKGVRAA